MGKERIHCEAWIDENGAKSPSGWTSGANMTQASIGNQGSSSGWETESLMGSRIIHLLRHKNQEGSLTACHW